MFTRNAGTTIEATYTIEKVQSVIDHLTRNFYSVIPNALLRLQKELAVCKALDLPVSEKTITWLSVIRNVLIVDKKMVMTPEKAELIEFLIV